MPALAHVVMYAVMGIRDSAACGCILADEMGLGTVVWKGSRKGRAPNTVDGARCVCPFAGKTLSTIALCWTICKQRYCGSYARCDRRART